MMDIKICEEENTITIKLSEMEFDKYFKKQEYVIASDTVKMVHFFDQRQIEFYCVKGE